MGIAYYYANDLSTAQVYFDTAKAYFTENEDDESLAQALNNLGVVAFRQGNASAAVELCEQALLVNSETENYISKLRIKFNLDYFTGAASSDIEDYYEQANISFGGGGSSGSGTTVKTGGGGTVVVNNGNGVN
jgi:tetratricopeptide (TPR) repeat protein